MSWKAVCHAVATASSFLILFLGSARGQPDDRKERVIPDIAFPKIKDWKSLRIKLERLGCYGPCPIYSLEVHGDGSVFYEGAGGIVFISGHHRDRISHAAVVGLVSAFREADYFSLKDIAPFDRDLPTYATSASLLRLYLENGFPPINSPHRF